MTVASLTVDRGRVTIHLRAEGPRGIVGDMTAFILPGEEFEGWTYEALRANGSGEITIPADHRARE